MLSISLLDRALLRAIYFKITYIEVEDGKVKFELVKREDSKKVKVGDIISVEGVRIPLVKIDNQYIYATAVSEMWDTEVDWVRGSQVNVRVERKNPIKLADIPSRANVYPIDMADQDEGHFLGTLGYFSDQLGLGEDGAKYDVMSTSISDLTGVEEKEVVRIVSEAISKYGKKKWMRSDYIAAAADGKKEEFVEQFIDDDPDRLRSRMNKDWSNIVYYPRRGCSEGEPMTVLAVSGAIRQANFTTNVDDFELLTGSFFSGGNTVSGIADEPTMLPVGCFVGHPVEKSEGIIRQAKADINKLSEVARSMTVHVRRDDVRRAVKNMARLEFESVKPKGDEKEDWTWRQRFTLLMMSTTQKWAVTTDLMAAECGGPGYICIPVYKMSVTNKLSGPLKLLRYNDIMSEGVSADKLKSYFAPVSMLIMRVLLKAYACVRHNIPFTRDRWYGMDGAPRLVRGMIKSFSYRATFDKIRSAKLTEGLVALKTNLVCQWIYLHLMEKGALPKVNCIPRVVGTETVDLNAPMNAALLRCETMWGEPNGLAEVLVEIGRIAHFTEETMGGSTYFCPLLK